MHAKPKADIILSESFGVRVTAEEKELLQQKATATGLSLSEYARQTLLRPQPDNRTLMAEMMATRKIIGGLLMGLINGAFESQDIQAKARMIKQVVDEADTTKWASAEKRILEVNKGGLR